MAKSKRYTEWLEQSKLAHQGGKGWHGKLFRPHAPFVRSLIQGNGCASVLDYGCGRGEQYTWFMPLHNMTLEEYLIAPVTKYDPAYPPFAKEPEGRFDITLVTHALGAIPPEDVPWVLDRIYSMTDKVVYIGEKIGPTSKRIVADQLMERNVDDWLAILDRPFAGKLIFGYRITGEGVIHHLERRTDGWHPVTWPPGVRVLDISWA